MQSTLRFWIRVAAILLGVAGLLLTGYAFIAYALTNSYHPNLVEGNIAFKFGWVFMLGLALSSIYVLALGFRRGDERTAKKLGLGVLTLVVIAGVGFFLTNVEREVSVEYYLGTEKYSIPWEYNPINGSTEPGGDYFVVHVAYPSFAGEYADQEAYSVASLTIAPYVEESRTNTASVYPDCGPLTCAFGYGNNFSIKENGIIYGMHYQGDTVAFETREEYQAFRDSVIGLIESFKEK